VHKEVFDLASLPASSVQSEAHTPADLLGREA